MPTRPAIRDDVAYILPMAIFLSFNWLAAQWPQAYPIFYPIKAILTAAALALLCRHYTRIRWSYWWLGVILGVIGVFQWVGMQLFLQQHWALFRPTPGAAFDPMSLADPVKRDLFYLARFSGAVLVVPVMEELFWRDFLWRQILAPNDFKLADVGEWGLTPFLIVAAAFASVHANWWPTAIVWGLMIGTLLAFTRSLGACIVMHATTNVLLGIYVLVTHDWSFW